MINMVSGTPSHFEDVLYLCKYKSRCRTTYLNSSFLTNKICQEFSEQWESS